MFLPNLRRMFFVLALGPATFIATTPQPANAALADLPPIDRIVNHQPKLPPQVPAVDGVEIAQVGIERREYLPLACTLKRLQDAVLSVEDACFRERKGINPKGMAHAALAMLTGGRTQSLSTITQQLVRTMLPRR